jgi:hypothetical protein
MRFGNTVAGLWWMLPVVHSPNAVWFVCCCEIPPQSSCCDEYNRLPTGQGINHLLGRLTADVLAWEGVAADDVVVVVFAAGRCLLMLMLAAAAAAALHSFTTRMPS